MKNTIKKISLIVIIGVMLFGLTACGSSRNSNVEGKLEDLMEKLYADIPDEEKPMFLENMEVNDENIESFIGTSNVDYEEILASESMVGSTAHSVILIRLKDGADVSKVKSEIKEKIDPRKWICVGIERDEVIVKNRGNLVLVVVVEDETNRDKISKNFDNL